MRLTLLRHATLVIEAAGLRLLVGPMLSPAGAVPPVPGTPSPRPNPLVPLPVPAEAAAAELDAVLVTHTHNDHFDAGAAAALARGLPLLCQPQDEAAFRGLGVADVRPVADEIALGPLRVARTGGRHGCGEIAERLRPVSGFVLRAPASRASTWPATRSGARRWRTRSAATRRTRSS